MTPIVVSKERLTKILRDTDGHTEGPWRMWTSNSYRRLSSDPSGRDGDVAYGTSYKDGTGDIVIPKVADQKLMEAAPELRMEVLRLQAENAILKQMLATRPCAECTKS